MDGLRPNLYDLVFCYPSLHCSMRLKLCDLVFAPFLAQELWNWSLFFSIPRFNVSFLSGLKALTVCFGNASVCDQLVSFHVNTESILESVFCEFIGLKNLLNFPFQDSGAVIFFMLMGINLRPSSYFSALTCLLSLFCA